MNSDTKNEVILIIDDEVQIRRLLEISLSANGYFIREAKNGKEGIALAATQHPSLILLDIGLPDIDGMEVLVRLREWFVHPIIILSVRNAEDEIIKALDSGADDYLTKPFRTGELLARIRTALRKGNALAAPPVLSFGDIQIDIASHIARKNNELLKLTATEFSLLAYLAKNEGRVLTHQALLKEIWGQAYIAQTQNLRVFIAQLRKKIEDDPARPKWLITEAGIGYRFGK